MTSITLDDILQTQNETVSDLPLKTIIDAYFDGTKHMHDFSHDVMIPQLKALFGPTAQEIALRDIYFKMYLFLGSAITMMVAVLERPADGAQKLARRAFRSTSGSPARSSPSRNSRSDRKKTRASALPASDAAWMIANEVVPSGRTPYSSPSRYAC